MPAFKPIRCPPSSIASTLAQGRQRDRTDRPATSRAEDMDHAGTARQGAGQVPAYRPNPAL